MELLDDDQFKELVAGQVEGQHKRIASVTPNLDAITSTFDPESTHVKEKAPPHFLRGLTSLGGSPPSIVIRDQALKNLHSCSLLGFSTATTQDAYVALERINQILWNCAQDLTDPATALNIPGETSRKLLKQEDKVSAMALLRRLQERQNEASDMVLCQPTTARTSCQLNSRVARHCVSG